MSASLDEIVQQIEAASHLLIGVQYSWDEALAQESGSQSSKDVDRLEELLEVATHETSSSLGFLLQDIRTLRQRIKIRRAHCVFSDDEFKRIIQEGWSL